MIFNIWQKATVPHMSTKVDLFFQTANVDLFFQPANDGCARSTFKTCYPNETFLKQDRFLEKKAKKKSREKVFFFNKKFVAFMEIDRNKSERQPLLTVWRLFISIQKKFFRRVQNFFTPIFTFKSSYFMAL